MDSEDAEDTEYQLIENQKRLDPSSPTDKKKKKKKKRVTPVEATIQVLQELPERASPLVGYFPSGFDPNSVEPSSTTVRVFRNKDKPKRLQLVATPPGSKVDFVGTNYTGEAEAGQQHCNYALGVLDKATQTLKVVPIASNKIFRLEPKVGYDKEPENLAVEESSSQQKADKVRELTNLYGTKKSINQAKKLHSLKLDNDPDSQKDLDGKIKEVVINKEALESTEPQSILNIPPYNTAATSPEEAYPLDKIIFKGEWNFLKDVYELLQKETEVSWDAYPTFISNRIHKLRQIQDDEEKTKLCCIFSYITHLIKYKDKHSMDGFSSTKRHSFPSIVRNKFSTMFADPEAKRMSADKLELLISYVLVLTLYADAFQTDYSDIAKDLRVSSLTLRPRFERLGCKIIRQNNLSLATLPIPLQFPQVRRKRRR